MRLESTGIALSNIAQGGVISHVGLDIGNPDTGRILGIRTADIGRKRERGGYPESEVGYREAGAGYRESAV